MGLGESAPLLQQGFLSLFNCCPGSTPRPDPLTFTTLGFHGGEKRLRCVPEPCWLTTSFQRSQTWCDADTLGPQMATPAICVKGGSGLLLPAFGDGEQEWPRPMRIVLYLIGLLWCFMGVALIADVFMSAIEKVTSKKVRCTDKTGRVYTYQVVDASGVVAGTSSCARVGSRARAHDFLCGGCLGKVARPCHFGTRRKRARARLACQRPMGLQPRGAPEHEPLHPVVGADTTEIIQ